MNVFMSNQVLRNVRADRSPASDGLSSALLVVYLDSAKNLPVRFACVPVSLCYNMAFCSCRIFVLHQMLYIYLDQFLQKCQSNACLSKNYWFALQHFTADVVVIIL